MQVPSGNIRKASCGLTPLPRPAPQHSDVHAHAHACLWAPSSTPGKVSARKPQGNYEPRDLLLSCRKKIAPFEILSTLYEPGGMLWLGTGEKWEPRRDLIRGREGGTWRRRECLDKATQETGPWGGRASSAGRADQFPVSSVSVLPPGSISRFPDDVTALGVEKRGTVSTRYVAFPPDRHAGKRGNDLNSTDTVKQNIKQEAAN